MCKIDAETILYISLVSNIKTHNGDHSCGASIKKIKETAEYAQTLFKDYFFDVSEDSLCAVVDLYPNIFMWKEEEIFFKHNFKLDRYGDVDIFFTGRLPRNMDEWCHTFVGVKNGV